MPQDYCTANSDIRIPDCIPTRATCTTDELKIKDVHIKQLDHGYIVTIGCKTIALSSAEQVLFGLKQYLKDPYKTQDLFEKGEFKFEK